MAMKGRIAIAFAAALALAGCGGGGGPVHRDAMPGPDDTDDGNPGGPDPGVDRPDLATMSLFALADNDELTTADDGVSFRAAVTARLVDAVTVPIHGGDGTFGFENGTDPARVVPGPDGRFSLMFGEKLEKNRYSLGQMDLATGMAMTDDGGNPVTLGRYAGYTVQGPLQRRGKDTPYLAWADVYRDDHLGFGVWMALKESPPSPNTFRLGAFGHRNAPGADPMMARGTAIYRGKAAGFRADEAGVRSFTADASLIARFDAPRDRPSTGYGSLSGTVRNADLTIDLGHASLSGRIVSGMAKTGGLSGHWKASFVPGPAVANDAQPGGVVGTFGISDGMNESVVGGFGTHRGPVRPSNSGFGNTEGRR